MEISLTPKEEEFMKLLKERGIVSVTELDSYMIMVAETLLYEKKIQKVSTKSTSIYIYPQNPFCKKYI